MDGKFLRNLIETQKYKENANFWDDNPEFLALKLFKDMRDTLRKKTGDDEQSSKFMWALYFIYHPKSPFIGMPPAIRIDLIEKDYLETPNFFEKFPDTIPFVDLYKEMTTHVAEYVVVNLRDKMYERVSLIKNTPYSIKTAKFLDEMVLNTERMLIELEKAEARLDKNQARKVKGDKKLSLNAKRELVPTDGSNKTTKEKVPG